jgi:hypothetical protein
MELKDSDKNLVYVTVTPDSTRLICYYWSGPGTGKIKVLDINTGNESMKPQYLKAHVPFVRFVTVRLYQLNCFGR